MSTVRNGWLSIGNQSFLDHNGRRERDCTKANGPLRGPLLKAALTLQPIDI